MTDDIEKFVNPAQPPERLSWTASQLDRRNENHHVVRMRQRRREANELVAREGVKLMAQLARIERYARANTEAKFELHRAKKESQILQDEDPELRAKFAVLDDDLFQRIRVDLLEDE